MEFWKKDIANIEFDLKSRDEIPQLLMGLQYIYRTPVIRPGQRNRAVRKDSIESRRKHSAVESCINALGSHGLDRCLDDGLHGFKRYVALSWPDRADHESFIEAALFIQTIQKRQGLKIACVEEIAWRMGYIDSGQLKQLAEPYMKNEYGQYLTAIMREKW